MFRKNIAAIN